MSQYKVIREHYFDKLEDLINVAAKDGYKVSGGITCDAHFFYILMVKDS